MEGLRCWARQQAEQEKENVSGKRARGLLRGADFLKSAQDESHKDGGITTNLLLGLHYFKSDKYNKRMRELASNDELREVFREQVQTKDFKRANPVGLIIDRFFKMGDAIKNRLINDDHPIFIMNDKNRERKQPPRVGFIRKSFEQLKRKTKSYFHHRRAKLFK